MEWQPIATAPKEQWAKIIAYDLAFGVCLAYWMDAEGADDTSGWYAVDGAGECPGDITHWMHPPEPPDLGPANDA